MAENTLSVLEIAPLIGKIFFSSLLNHRCKATERSRIIGGSDKCLVKRCGSGVCICDIVVRNICLIHRETQVVENCCERGDFTAGWQFRVLQNRCNGNGVGIRNRVR